MGKIKYLPKVMETFERNVVVSLGDIKRILLLEKANPAYAAILTHNLLKKGKIHQITKGHYSKHDDPILIAYCIKPSYVGLEAALSFHNLWEQETNIILLTPRRIRTGRRIVLENNVLVHAIGKKHFFGFEYVGHDNLKVPVSDIEKTFIDLIAYHHQLDKKILRLFKKRVDIRKMRDYLQHYDRRIASQIETMLGIGLTSPHISGSHSR
ncbi:hypothetical protein HZB01_00040 [Candidatus Woesearchaeota archaeon]|nr:hypothetical protein [Candidatus Woesearchaeota archaeon]